MEVNKGALYALAAFYERLPHRTNGRTANTYFCSDDRKYLSEELQMCTLHINYSELRKAVDQMETFFKFPSGMNYNATFYCHITCADVAKFIRYIAKHSKFPPKKRLHYHNHAT